MWQGLKPHPHCRTIIPNLDSLVPMHHSTLRLLIILFSALPLLSAPNNPSGNEGLVDTFDNDGIRLAISPDCVSPWTGPKKPSYEINARVNWSEMRWATLRPCRCNPLSNGLLGSSFRTVVVFGDSVSRPASRASPEIETNHHPEQAPLSLNIHGYSHHLSITQNSRCDAFLPV